MSQQDSRRLLKVMDERFDQNLRAKGGQWHIGTVSTVNAASRTATVTIQGNATASQNFSYPAYMKPAIGDIVRVYISPNGYRWIENLQSGGMRTDDAIRLEDNTASPTKGLLFGSAGDVNLYRENSARLRTDDGLSVGGALLLSSGATVTGVVQADRVRVTDSTDAALASTDHGLQIGLGGSTNLIMDGDEIMARNNGAASTLHLNAEGGDVTVNSVVNNGGVMRVWNRLALGTNSTPANTIGMLFGADIELYRAAANELRTATGDSVYGSAHARNLYKSSSLSLTSGTWTVVTSWSTTPFAGVGVTYDGTDELVVTLPGLYIAAAGAAIDSSSAGMRAVGVSINDTTTAALDTSRHARQGPNSDGLAEIVWWTGFVTLSANDRVCMKVMQNSGGALNLTHASFGLAFLGY